MSLQLFSSCYFSPVDCNLHEIFLSSFFPPSFVPVLACFFILPLSYIPGISNIVEYVSERVSDKCSHLPSSYLLLCFDQTSVRLFSSHPLNLFAPSLSKQ